MSLEFGKQVLIDSARGVLNEKQIEKQKRESLRERKRNREYFLNKSEELLECFGVEPEKTNGSPVRITPPLNIDDDGENISIHLAKYLYYFYDDITKCLAITATTSDNPEPYFLFSIEQTLSNIYNPPRVGGTIIRNEFSTRASNDDVIKGVAVLNFIADELTKSNAPPK